MRKILLLPLICLLLTGCTIGIARQGESTPTALPPTPTPTCTAQPTLTPTTWPPESTEPPMPSPTLPAPTPSSIPTALPTPAPTAIEEASTGPTILYFRASVEEADPGDTVVLEWASTGATKAILYRIPSPGGTWTRPARSHTRFRPKNGTGPWFNSTYLTKRRTMLSPA